MNTTVQRGYNGENATSLSFATLLIRCLIFTGVFALLSTAFILIFSGIFYNTTNPTAKIEIASLASLYLSVAICSSALTRINSQKWLFGGLILGCMIYITTLFFAIFIQDDPNTENIILRAIIPILSTVFAFLSRKKDKKRPKIKARKYR